MRIIFMFFFRICDIFLFNGFFKEVLLKFNGRKISLVINKISYFIRNKIIKNIINKGIIEFL